MDSHQELTVVNTVRGIGLYALRDYGDPVVDEVDGKGTAPHREEQRKLCGPYRFAIALQVSHAAELHLVQQVAALQLVVADGRVYYLEQERVRGVSSPELDCI